MNNVNDSIAAFVNQEIDFYTLKMAFASAINTNVKAFSISTIINNPALIKSLSESEYIVVVQMFEKNNQIETDESTDTDKTIIQSDTDDDKTVLSDTSNNRTTIKAQPTNDLAFIEEHADDVQPSTYDNQLKTDATTTVDKQEPEQVSVDNISNDELTKKNDDQTVIAIEKNDQTVIANQNDDQTIIANQDEDRTIIAKQDDDQTLIASQDDDKTILAKPRTIERAYSASKKNHSDKETVLASPNTDATIVDDKTRIPGIQIHDQDETIAVPHPPSNGSSNVDQNKLEPGRIINNRFVLESLLGQGGMGSVFKARDLRKEEAQDSNSHIAIKFLNDDFKQHPQALMSLQREAKKSQTLAHPNIITVHDFDRDGDTVYMTMEFLDGAPLDEYLIKHKNTGIEKETALNIIDDLSRALAYAHQKHIVHSDFKPGNVFITKDGTAKVLDFGIARAVKKMGDGFDDSNTEKTLFDAGDLGGLTPSYASCEMLEGKQPSPSDDMYALGCVAYELLSGTHPFAKKPATRARDGGLIPPVLKNLNKKQSSALLHTLQFAKITRTVNAQTFIEEFSVRKQNSKGLIASLAIAALLLLGIGVKYFLDYQTQISINEMVSNIQQGSSTAIAESIPTLQSLEGDMRETVLSDIRPMVVQYYANKALPLADQGKGQYDFPAALKILAEAKTLYPDSAQLNDLILQLINNQNQLLNTLALQIDKYLQKGKLTSAVYNNDIQDIIDLLKIAAPDSHLLKDQRIQLAYVRELKNAIKQDKLDNANVLITSALTLFDTDKEILSLRDNLKAREVQIVEDQQLVALQNQLVEKGKKISEPLRLKALKRNTEILDQLIQDGFNSPTWPNEVQTAIVALDVFARSKLDKQWKLRNKAATLILKNAKKTRRAGDLEKARSLLKQVGSISPKLAGLEKEKRALVVTERKQQKSLKDREKVAKISALKETLLDQAASNDVKKATRTFKRLKKFAPNSRFIKTDAREAIANAYLRLAKRFAKRKEYKNAIQLTKAGIKIAPRYIAAKNARNQYQAEIAINKLNANLKNIETISVKSSKKYLKSIKLGLPDRFDDYETKASKRFLDRIKSLAKTDQAKAKYIIDKARLIFPNSKEISALTKRSSKFQSAGGQPCKSNYAGHGRRTRATCFDMITSSIKAPLMIVVPAMSNKKKAFAVSKYEISVAEYNQYCGLSKKCKKSTKNNSKLPKTNISAKKINDYLKWLSAKTHQNYRLPTDIEWQHAANANGKNSKKDINCRLMLGNKQIKGNELLNTKSGKQNGWGLKNTIGNVQEIVTRGSKLYVRGGAHTDSFSQCNIKLKRSHSGKADAITGFRIIKVL